MTEDRDDTLQLFYENIRLAYGVTAEELDASVKRPPLNDTEDSDYEDYPDTT